MELIFQVFLVLLSVTIAGFEISKGLSFIQQASNSKLKQIDSLQYKAHQTVEPENTTTTTEPKPTPPSKPDPVPSDSVISQAIKKGVQQFKIIFGNATKRKLYVSKYQCSLLDEKQRGGECLEVIEPWLTAKLIRRNGAQLVQNLSAELEKQMKHKTDAVKAAFEAAEKAYVDYESDESLKGITYFNAKRINRPNLVDRHFEVNNPYRYFSLAFNTHFKAGVNLSKSVVHVPTNVFDGSAEINNGAQWTKKINDVFYDNREKDPTMYWQYFGSALGFYRVFPGSKWATDKADMFDCRTKGWYIQASCSPKDLVILLDSSGSMLGLRLRIAINTVDQILKTLGEDDFFNIMKFDSSTEYVDQCFNGTMIQATTENKERLLRKVRDIEPKEMANFEKALTEAFQLFNKTSEDKVGSICNRAIMLITDGAHDTYDEVFERYNDANFTSWAGQSQVRLFSYLIGQDSSYNRELHKMACRNKGYYVEIKTIASVKDNMKQYVTTFARPLALADFNDVTWTGVYIDDAEYDYQKLKKKNRRSKKKKKLLKSSIPDMSLMTSVAAPVFNRKPDSTKQDLLGVVGTDLPIHFFRTFIPPPRFGVGAYAFVVNHNGFVLFHPSFKPPFEAPDYTQVDVSKLEIKFLPWEWYKKMRQAYNGPLPGYKMTKDGLVPDFIEVDKNDTDAAVERLIALLRKVNATLPDYKIKLRRSMVRGSTGRFWMTTLKTVDNHARPKIVPMHYFFSPIPFTPFTVGVAMPGHRTSTFDYGFVQLNATIDVKSVNMSILHEQEGLQTKIPSQWTYCDFTAEELEVTEEDYQSQLKDMYHEFNEIFEDSGSFSKAKDAMESLEPPMSGELYCSKLNDELEQDDTVLTYNGSKAVYNMTALRYYNSTYNAIDHLTFMTKSNETVHYYTFNQTKCTIQVKDHHIEQLREDMQAWMFEKKFKGTLLSYLEKGQADKAANFNTKCNQDTVEALLFDAELTKDTMEQLQPPLQFYQKMYDVSMIFIATRSGLTRYLTPDHSESDFINTHPETIRESYYERAVEAGPDTLMVSMYPLPQSPKRVIVAQSLFIQHITSDGNTGRAAVAVVGLEMPAFQFGKMFLEQNCSSNDTKCLAQCSNLTTCYLLDDNGYIVYAEKEKNLGNSLATVDPDLFIDLTNYYEIIDDSPTAKKDMPLWESGTTSWSNLYEMIFFDDYQDICPVYEDIPKGSAGIKLINPFISFSRIMKRFVTVLATSLIFIVEFIGKVIANSPLIPSECLEFLFDGNVTDEFWNCTINQTNLNEYQFDSRTTYKRRPKMIDKRACTTRYNLYRINPRATRLSGAAGENCHDCSTCQVVLPDGFCYACTGFNEDGVLLNNLTNYEMPVCTRTWRAQLVPETNLLFLVVRSDCVCQRNPKIVEILQNKTLVYQDDDEQCQLLKMQRERRLPNKCASDNPQEDVSVCSARQLFQPANIIAIFVTSLIVLSWL